MGSCIESDVVRTFCFARDVAQRFGSKASVSKIRPLEQVATRYVRAEFIVFCLFALLLFSFFLPLRVDLVGGALYILVFYASPHLHGRLCATQPLAVHLIIHVAE